MGHMNTLRMKFAGQGLRQTPQTKLGGGKVAEMR